MARKPLKILMDTNIVLDVFLPSRNVSAIELQNSNDVWQASDKRKIIAYISASSLTDIFYIADSRANNALARQVVHTCLKSLRICTVDYATLDHADQLPGSDFEDNVQIACALRYGLDAIITRDRKFHSGIVPLLTPTELLKQI